MAAPADSRSLRQRFLYLGVASGLLLLVMVTRMSHRKLPEAAGGGMSGGDVAMRLKVCTPLSVALACRCLRCAVTAARPGLPGAARLLPRHPTHAAPRNHALRHLRTPAGGTALASDPRVRVLRRVAFRPPACVAQYFLAGSICACLSHVGGVPIDVLKTRLQTDPGRCARQRCVRREPYSRPASRAASTR